MEIYYQKNEEKMKKKTQFFNISILCIQDYLCKLTMQKLVVRYVNKIFICFKSLYLM